MEHQLIFKGGGDERDGDSSKVFAYLFQYWREKPIFIFSLCILAHACYVEFKLAKTISSLYVTLVFFVYMYKLVYRNNAIY